MGKSKRDRIIELVRNHGVRYSELESLADAIMQLFEKKKKQPEESYPDFVEAWCEAYPIIGMGDGKISGAMINRIIAKTRTTMESNGKAATREGLTNAFKYVIDYVKRTKHFCDEKPLTTWNSQYLSIITEISSGKQIAKQMKANGSSQVFGKYGN